MVSILKLFQVVLSICLILLVLFQSKGGGLSSVFGGEGTIYQTRRGVEKVLYYLTIITSIVFFVTSLLILLIV